MQESGSNSQKFQRASVLKHGDGKGKRGAVKSQTWVAPVSKKRKKRRKRLVRHSCQVQIKIEEKFVKKPEKPKSSVKTW